MFPRVFRVCLAATLGAPGALAAKTPSSLASVAGSSVGAFIAPISIYIYICIERESYIDRYRYIHYVIHYVDVDIH